MTSSSVHELMVVSFFESLLDAIRRQRARNPLLKTPLWRVHTNRSSWYQDGGDDQYTADLSIFFDNALLFAIEIAFTQRWEILKCKLDRMLADDGIWGALAIKITEASPYSCPTRTAMQKDFISSDAWNEQALLAQAVDEYGALSVNGIEWMKSVDVDVFFFPADWRIGDEDPQPVSHLIHSFCDISLHRCSIHCEAILPT